MIISNLTIHVTSTVPVALTYLEVTPVAILNYANRAWVAGLVASVKSVEATILKSAAPISRVPRNVNLKQIQQCAVALPCPAQIVLLIVMTIIKQYGLGSPFIVAKSRDVQAIVRMIQCFAIQEFHAKQTQYTNGYVLQALVFVFVVISSAQPVLRVTSVYLIMRTLKNLLLQAKNVEVRT